MDPYTFGILFVAGVFVFADCVGVPGINIICK